MCTKLAAEKKKKSKMSNLACRCAQRACASCVQVLVEQVFYLLVGRGFAEQWSCFKPHGDVSA